MTLAARLSGFSKSNPVAAAAVLGIAVVAGATIHSTARSGNTIAVAAPTPAVIGLVDIAKLMNSLQELKDRNDLTMAKGKQLQEKLTEISSQIKQIDTELKDVIPKDDKAKRIERLAQRVELEATYEARGKAYQRIIDLDHGDILNDLYPKATAAVQAYAAKEGYDVVLLDDRPMQLPDSGSVKDYNEVIQKKRILFAKDGVDITDQLITVMNNEYAASMKKTKP
jgi:Skp family chaperone for outer membrane proteins